MPLPSHEFRVVEEYVEVTKTVDLLDERIGKLEAFLDSKERPPIDAQTLDFLQQQSTAMTDVSEAYVGYLSVLGQRLGTFDFA